MELIVAEFSSVRDAVAMAKLAKQCLDQYPKACIEMACSGFDNDERELDQIAEAREMVGAFGDELGTRYLCRFHPGITAMILLCMGMPDIERVGYQFVMTPALANRMASAAREWES